MAKRAVLRAFFLGALLLGAIPAAPARASVSIAVTIDALVHDATSIAVVTPVESRAVWENQRIVTYTRVHVDRAVAGALATNDETWVASLGGIVGTVGQVVDGEPVLHVGVPYLVFLKPDATATAGTHVVVGRAQGQYHLKTVKPAVGPAVVNVLRNPNAGEILPPKALPSGTLPKTAVDALANRPVDDVAKDLAAQWKKAHAP